MGGTVSRTYELLENLYYYDEAEGEVDGVKFDLPNNVLSKVVSMLSGSEVLRAAAVSKRWRDFLEHDEGLWQELFLRDFGREALLRCSGRTWRAAYVQEYKSKVDMFKQNTEKIASILGFQEFDSSSKASYNALVAFMEKKLDNNLTALKEAGIQA
ncbi:hypothetical protein BSKO_02304 [Bryopsis sp. KO-2023]|nr:hypothetical protein BSKO_02304 [Bryopsis sp. KO-2023]